ncbi:unnamed protein product (mitochondrion) [Plasmodiophora brassicae]|uniref:UmuC domain-containing protein n=1 Tax=Plasmodiophora brassicae TaxID=37360 RepID=A0A3P3YE91_PLABS|nr:unnamed protein product [Plasmodiophora brassicae]
MAAAAVSREVALVDLDCFYCQVEQKRLGIPREVPVAVRQWDGLVAINYAARARGLSSRHFSSAQTIADLQRQCPDLVLVHTDTTDADGVTTSYRPGERPVSKDACKVNLGRYRQASGEVMAVLCAFSPLISVEKASIDEAFLDVTALVTARVAAGDVPEAWAGRFAVDGDDGRQGSGDEHARMKVAADVVDAIRRRVFDELGFTCSAGVAGNKTLAKLISGRNKPFGQTILLQDDVPLLMASVKLTSIRGLGRKLGQALCALGPATPADVLSRFTLDGLAEHFSEGTAQWIWDICHGMDEDPVQEKGPPRSIMSSKTFSRALGTRQALNDWLTRLALDIFNRIEDDCNQFQRVPTLLNLSSRGVSRSAPIRGQDLEALHPQLVKASLDMGEHVVLPCTGVSLRVSSFTALIQPRSKIDMFFARSDPVQAPAQEEEDPAAGNEDHDQPRPFYCGRCGRTITGDDIATHSDYHLALALQSYEKRELAGVPRRPSAKRPRNQRTISSFFGTRS